MLSYRIKVMLPKELDTISTLKLIQIKRSSRFDCFCPEVGKLHYEADSFTLPHRNHSNLVQRGICYIHSFSSKIQHLLEWYLKGKTKYKTIVEYMSCCGHFSIHLDSLRTNQFRPYKMPNLSDYRHQQFVLLNNLKNKS